MANLSTTVNGLKIPNPFVIGSGPPGTNANVIGKAFDEGWGAVIARRSASKLTRSSMFSRDTRSLRSRESNEIYGWENIELISDRSFETWIDEFKQLQRQISRSRFDRFDHGRIPPRRLDRNRRALPGRWRRCIRNEFVLPARLARTQNGLGHGCMIRTSSRR